MTTVPVSPAIPPEAPARSTAPLVAPSIAPPEVVGHVVRVGRQRGTLDGNLVQAQGGDAAAFGRFYDRHAAELLGWFRVRTAATEVAADLCAETFATALECVERFDPSLGDETAWLYGIARNELRHWIRRHYVDQRARRRLGIHVTIPHDDLFDAVETRIDLERRIGCLDDAVRRLSPKGRDALVLRVVHELSYREIAERLGCREVTARVRVSRALSDLVAHLPEAGAP